MNKVPSAKTLLNELDQDCLKFILMDKPKQVKVRQVLQWLDQNDEAAKKHLIDVIYHRLHRRYIVPLAKIRKKYRSGFLMMATACLMIETLQSFYEGLPDTKGESKATFDKFFKREKELFPELASHVAIFYYDVRCGILHQAEIRGGVRIWRDKGTPLFDPINRIINAREFMIALKTSLYNYIDALKRSDTKDKIWKNAHTKLIHICKNCSKSQISK
jgi:hypothetical protein